VSGAHRDHRRKQDVTHPHPRTVTL
jgi:hypothetical protein